MKTYKALVRLRNSAGTSTVSVYATVQATNPFDAKLMLEAQYGRGCVIGVVVEC